MKTKLMVGASIAAFAAMAWGAKDPVVMTVNGVDVPQSEFEYLYHKNSKQQLDPQPLDRYVEMFKLYKMKVADAQAEGLDTMASFRREMEQYRHELAQPYLADSLYINALAKEAYQRAQEEVEARHIMILKKGTEAADNAAVAKLDSLRVAIMGGADFSTLAKEYSEDRASAPKGGYLGYISINRFPYNFEKTAFGLKEGEVSGVVESPVAYHILIGGKHRPSRGTVLASHILKMSPDNAPDDAKAEAKAEIDSIYNRAISGAETFESLALNNSDDKGSARQGGLLPWFGAGEMVEEFESVAFALPTDSISKPFRTRFGWHIIKKINSKGIAPFEELKPQLVARITHPQDERSRMVREDHTARLAYKHKGSKNSKLIDAMTADVAKTGLDSAFMAKYSAAPYASQALFTIGKKAFTAAEAMSAAGKMRQSDPYRALPAWRNFVDGCYYRELIDAEEEWLAANVADYRNLLNEYHDGSLLYEVSLRKVWDKASKDTEGLKNYFEQHRADYAWNEPHVKGLLVQATNDSVANAVRLKMQQTASDSIVRTIRKEFPGEAQIERVLVAKGENPMVDHLMFDGKEVSPSNSGFTSYFLYDARVLDTPEEVNDVRGLVTSDYQNELEAAWIEELKTKYPVTINHKTLKKIK